jgi:hypothetical protein
MCNVDSAEKPPIPDKSRRTHPPPTIVIVLVPRRRPRLLSCSASTRTKDDDEDDSQTGIPPHRRPFSAEFTFQARPCKAHGGWSRRLFDVSTPARYGLAKAAYRRPQQGSFELLLTLASTLALTLASTLALTFAVGCALTADADLATSWQQV